jgi:single-stranded DNA-binding protein
VIDGITCAFIGRVVGEGAQLKFTSSGTALVSVSVLVRDSKAADGDGQFARVGHFGDDAEDLAPQLVKGVDVYIEGKLKLNTWQAADGAPRSGLNVTAWKLEPIGTASIGRRAEQSRSASRPRLLASAGRHEEQP